MDDWKILEMAMIDGCYGMSRCLLGRSPGEAGYLFPATVDISFTLFRSLAVDPSLRAAEFNRGELCSIS